MDGNLHLGTVGLLLHNPIDVDTIAAAVNRGDLACRLLGELATNNLNLILFPDGQRTDLHYNKRTSVKRVSMNGETSVHHTSLDVFPSACGISFLLDYAGQHDSEDD